MTPKIRKIHRWLGLIFSLSILMSAGSGVLHNIMSRTQPPPPAARPSGAALNPSLIKISVSQAFEKLAQPEKKLVAVNLRSIGGKAWYQLFLDGEGAPKYINAESGELNESEDEVYASEIAQSFLGGATVKRTDYLKAFNAEYINIFRILPVYRFDVDDGRGTRVYVSTVTGSVTRHTDNQRQFEANTFSYLHKLMFIHHKDVRDAVLTMMTGGIFVLSLVGVVLFFVTRR